MKAKTIIYTTILLLLTAVTLSSCTVNAEESGGPPAPNPIQMLEAQVETERRLRLDPEAQVQGETKLRERWELTALGLGFLAIAGFVGGTAIGSKGSRHVAIPT
jgi:hypothetical protein